MKHLFIVRHGQTEWNVLGRMQGRLDSPLTEQGRVQAGVNGKLLKSLGSVAHLWVSPSGRTMETAYIVNSYTHSRLLTADELMERDCGEWSGFTARELEDTYPDEWARRSADPYYFQPPGGENMHDMLVRVHAFLEELYAAGYENVGLITHGVMSKVILKYYLNLTEVEAARVRHPNNLVYRLTFHAKDIETHHFIEGGEAQAGLLRRASVPLSHPLST